MWPILFEFPAESNLPPAAPYGLMVMTGVVLGQALAFELARRMGLDRVKLMVASVVAILTGFVGAKVLYHWATGTSFSLLGGFAFYGGAITGGLGLVVAARLQGMPVWKVLDLAAPVIVLGHAVGRMGCFFAGCCHGVAVPHPEPAWPLLPEGLLHGQVWLHPHAPFVSNTFTAGVSRLQDVALYPTQLWLVVGNLMLLAVALRVWSRRRFDGQVAVLVLAVEPMLRATVEVFRGDHRGYAVAWQSNGGFGTGSAGGALDAGMVGITTSQGIALGLMVVAGVLYLLRRNAGVAPEDAEDADYDDLID